MMLHVSSKVVFSCAHEIAEFTFVRLITSMCQYVVLQVTGSVGRIHTHVTLESFDTSVLAHVVA